MPKPRVFVTRRIPKEGLDRIQKSADVEVWEGRLPPSYEELLARVEGLEGLVCLLTDRIDEELLEKAGPALKVISQYAVGVDNIDLAAATRRAIPVGHTPGTLTQATADFTWALLMAAARRVVEADKYVRAGKWQTWEPELLLGSDVAGAVLGIVGLGRIGQAVARRAVGFQMKIIYTDVARKPDLERELGASYLPLENLLKEADFITLHAPLTAETYHLIGPKEFEAMKSSAVLINCARGAMVDPEALYSALVSGRIRHAALDVTEPEPINEDSPFMELENLTLAPHIASASYHARQKMAMMAADNLEAGLAGEKLPHCANPEVYGA